MTSRNQNRPKEKVYNKPVGTIKKSARTVYISRNPSVGTNQEEPNNHQEKPISRNRSAGTKYHQQQKQNMVAAETKYQQ